MMFSRPYAPPQVTGSASCACGAKVTITVANHGWLHYQLAEFYGAHRFCRTHEPVASTAKDAEIPASERKDGDG
jgi:hypothetical protein